MDTARPRHRDSTRAPLPFLPPFSLCQCRAEFLCLLWLRLSSVAFSLAVQEPAQRPLRRQRLVPFGALTHKPTRTLTITMLLNHQHTINQQTNADAHARAASQRNPSSSGLQSFPPCSPSCTKNPHTPPARRTNLARAVNLRLGLPCICTRALRERDNWQDEEG